jgi:DNA-binding beta-propeller fold protein YncE
VTPDGELAFVANSDFYGDRPRVNPLSIVHTPSMTTITNLPVCDMPHGVKVNHAGGTVYVSCMHSDELLELDISTLSVVRRVKTGSGHATAECATTSMRTRRRRPRRLQPRPRRRRRHRLPPRPPITPGTTWVR